MLCQICSINDAETKKTIIVGGKNVTIFVCRDCYNKSENSFINNNISWDTREREVKCHTCGTTLSDVKDTNFVGCVNCYKTFANEIDKEIYYLQGKSSHVGKIPADKLARTTRVKEMEELMKQYGEGELSPTKLNEMRKKIFKLGDN